MASKPETRVVKNIMKALQQNYPGYYFKTHGGLFQRAGLPDIIGVHKGRFIGIEVKCPGKEDTLTQLQEKTLLKLSKAGAIAFMATSPEEVLQKLKESLGGKTHVKEKCNKSEPRRKKPKVRSDT